MNQNWIVENLNNAFSTWNGKLTELWGLVTTSPQTFKGGAVWGVMQSLHNAMIGIGYALIVLFFAISLFKNTANFHELKRPEAAVHYLIRFVAAKTLVGYGMDIMLNIFSICNGVVSDMAAGMGGISQAMVALPGEVQAAIENVGFLASIPLWLVTILGSLFITVLSFVMILTVYGRFFRLYMYTALAPLPLASFAGESTQSVGISFIGFLEFPHLLGVKDMNLSLELPQSAIFSESVDKAVPVDRGGLQTDHNITELHGAECRYDSF